MGQARRTVKWNESNLEKNKDYFTSHPILYEINEPKTPFVHNSDLLAVEEQEAMEKTLINSPAGTTLCIGDHSTPSREISLHDDDSSLTDTPSPIPPCEDSMSSNDGDTWRQEENQLAHEAKVAILQKLGESDDQTNSNTDVCRETTGEEKTDSIKRKKGKLLFESMRKAVLQDERKRFKESCDHHV
ncbi:hypothetical protein XU18_4640 [Perkinsela sp. CCAP 1560/4]|nr:hypothetical protein XU18_4640 [Perkinsela sp. CCAP 1560/4]|eukprot:KNH04072.1 hypothetical protein XU18_4640 [Perkinsela sp. CCAP 1560/4]